jgi:hypothetical protein
MYETTSETSEEQNGGNQMKINSSRTCLNVDVHPQNQPSHMTTCGLNHS